MRHPLLTRFAVVSIVAFSGLVIACAKSEDPDLFGPVTNVEKTDPVEAGTPKKLPPKTQKITPPPPAIVDAGRTPDASPPEEPEPPVEDPPECPQDFTHQLAVLAASAGGTATACPGGGADCSAGECCYVNALLPAANLCIKE